MIDFPHNMAKHTFSTNSRLLRRIRSHGRGWVFTPSNFRDLGTSTAVNIALMRHVRDGTVRKISRGIYEYPTVDPRLGPIPPAPDKIISALSGRDQSRIQASGAHAANLLGLSDQVPVRPVYLSDSRSKRIRIGNRQIVIKKTTPRQMATAGRISGTVIQALRWLGRKNVNDVTVNVLRHNISDNDKQQILKDSWYAPDWIAAIMRKVATDPTT